jgi:hypothetical protein
MEWCLLHLSVKSQRVQSAPMNVERERLEQRKVQPERVHLRNEDTKEMLL